MPPIIHDLASKALSLVDFIREVWSSLTTVSVDVVDIAVEDLPGLTLAIADDHRVLIDEDAAGHGWFMDLTPWDSAEFPNVLTSWEHRAGFGSNATGRIDLLTVLAHEFGHLLGFSDVSPDIDPTRLMTAVLPPGVRRMPSAFDLAWRYVQGEDARTRH